MPGNAEQNLEVAEARRKLTENQARKKARSRYEYATFLYAPRTSKRIKQRWLPQHSGCATSTRQGVSHSRRPCIRLFAGGSGVRCRLVPSHSLRTHSGMWGEAF